LPDITAITIRIMSATRPAGKITITKHRHVTGNRSKSKSKNRSKIREQ